MLQFIFNHQNQYVFMLLKIILLQISLKINVNVAKAVKMTLQMYEIQFESVRTKHYASCLRNNRTSIQHSNEIGQFCEFQNFVSKFRITCK